MKNTYGNYKAVGKDFENWPAHCTNWLYSIGMTQDTVEIPEEPSANPDILMKENDGIHMKIMPNPVSEHTLINYSVNFQGNAKISLFDITGREIYVLVNEKMSLGEYTYSLASLSSELEGFFIIRFQNGKQLIEEKVFF